MDDKPHGAPDSQPSHAWLVIAFLLGVIVLQWVFHALTAIALFAYMGRVEGSPTAKTLDSVFFGFGCVTASAVLSLIGGWVGAKALAKRYSAAKHG
jgi:hypothetical protein